MERNVTFIALMAAFTAVLGLIPTINLIPGVPIALQVMGVMLCGLVLGAKRGALAVVLFLVLAAIGLPILTGFRGGLAPFAGATAGFLYGYVAAAFATGFVFERWKGNLIVGAIVASLIGGVLVLYPIGTVWLASYLEKPVMAMAQSMLAFVPGDIIKAVIAGLITAKIAKARPAAILSRQAS
ncbi:biotin transporter BioY [Halocynthiibacter styelae]|uniref:Biotin transporter n=1 Tax=Halocynthiibacter styelae TaxID=2761955 RepID=A0A8J7LTU0_9RHOB|nr:biotin transporter BioY [Paenihalocynthiibacter styelae]MBI1492187.1 biotin transporter BioY [Paenihalocynthiibacter styelae]